MIPDRPSLDWEHFSQNTFFKQTVDAGSDVMVIGLSKAGKTSLLQQFEDRKIITIECSIFKLSSTIQGELLSQLSVICLPRWKKESPRQLDAFISAIEAACEPLISLTIVFHDCEKFFQNSSEEFTEFFIRYTSFVNVLDQSGLQLQTFALSRLDLPLPYVKFQLPYPDDNNLKAHLIRHIQSQQFKNEIKQENTQLIRVAIRCLAFNLLFSSFEALEIVMTKLIRILDCEGDAFPEESQLFLRCEALFYRNPKLIYAQKRKLLELISREDSGPSLSSRSPLGLSPLCCCLLIAIHLCILYKPSMDMAVMGNSKKNSKSMNFQGKSPLNSKPLKFARLWRILNLAQMVMKFSSDNIHLENRRIFHSSEFFGCLDFLDNVGLVECFAKTRFDKSYRLRCDELFIEDIMRVLGLTNDLYMPNRI